MLPITCRYALPSHISHSINILSKASYRPLTTPLKRWTPSPVSPSIYGNRFNTTHIATFNDTFPLFALPSIVKHRIKAIATTTILCTSTASVIYNISSYFHFPSFISSLFQAQCEARPVSLQIIPNDSTDSCMHDPINPFINRTKYTIFESIKLVLMSVIALVRIPLIFITGLFPIYLCCRLATLGLEAPNPGELCQPLLGWRRFCLYPIPYISRYILFLTGCFYFKQVGKPAEREVAPVLVCAPHSSFLDSVVVTTALPTPPIGVSRFENLNYLVISSIFLACQAIFVDRASADSRKQVLHNIKKVVADNERPYLCIFPEGTCTNREAIVSYKKGAFISGSPVQPVVIKYPFSHFDVSWVVDGPGVMSLLWRLCSQVYNNIEIHFLPVYYPSVEEKKDFHLYSKNVQVTMANYLNVPATDHGYDDVRLQYASLREGLSPSVGVVEALRVTAQTGWRYDELKDLLKPYKNLILLKQRQIKKQFNSKTQELLNQANIVSFASFIYFMNAHKNTEVYYDIIKHFKCRHHMRHMAREASAADGA